MKNKFSIAMSLAVILAMLITSLALADVVGADSDVVHSGNQNSVDLTAAPGDPVTVSTHLIVDYQGGSHLVAGSTLGLQVWAQGTVLPAGATVSPITNITVPTPWDANAGTFDAGISTISFTAPSGSGLHVYTVKWDNGVESCTSDNQDCVKSGDAFTINLTVSTPTPANLPPTVNAGDPYSGVEGSAISLDGTVSDPDNDALTTTWTYALVSGNAAATCTFGDASAVDTTITCNDNGSYTATLTADDWHGHVVSADAAVTVMNANPDVAAPSWATASVACRVPATLTGISFSDAGVIDYTWHGNIAWQDGSTNFDASAQGVQANQTHTYNIPGSYTATVGVTDKDGGYGSNSTPASGPLTVLQTYTVKFLQPFDGSSPSNLITNTMKSGRVVPVKVTIYDDCAQTYVTDPTAMVKIFVSLASSNSSSNDAVEVYADAGASNGNTLNFRWTSDSSAPGGGFWIYNLDSRTVLGGSALVIGKTYKVDVYVGAVKATATTWALLTPVK